MVFLTILTFAGLSYDPLLSWRGFQVQKFPFWGYFWCFLMNSEEIRQPKMKILKWLDGGFRAI